MHSAHRPRGTFTFSLDFELAWGTRGRPNASAVPPYLAGTRAAIRGLLDLFEQYEVSGTWAIVGGLLLPGTDTRRHPWLSSSEFADIPAGNAATQPYWHAEDVIDWLQACGTSQEIGCHTLTHYFVDPGPAGRETLHRELELFLELCEQQGLERPRSFIFPKAKMGHFDVLAELGFRCFRGPENGWFETLPGERLRAGFRLCDARLSCPPRVERPVRTAEGLWRIPSSQFYSPFMSVGRYVSLEARVKKALHGLRRAARTGGVFHLWTHPFNLGVRTSELLDGLRQILQEANRLRYRGELDILPMGALAAQLDESAKQLLSPSQPVAAC